MSKGLGYNPRYLLVSWWARPEVGEEYIGNPQIWTSYRVYKSRKGRIKVQRYQKICDLGQTPEARVLVEKSLKSSKTEVLTWNRLHGLCFSFYSHTFFFEPSRWSQTARLRLLQLRNRTPPPFLGRFLREKANDIHSDGVYVVKKKREQKSQPKKSSSVPKLKFCFIQQHSTLPYFRNVVGITAKRF